LHNSTVFKADPHGSPFAKAVGLNIGHHCSISGRNNNIAAGKDEEIQCSGRRLNIQKKKKKQNNMGGGGLFG
jgi:hypothetical protein